MAVSDLINEYIKLGGMLGILNRVSREIPTFMNQDLQKYSEQAYNIWKSAFPNTNIKSIPPDQISRYYALFHAIYARSSSATKQRLSIYLQQYDELYNNVRPIIDTYQDMRQEIQELIEQGEDIRPDVYSNYQDFLKDLHEWVNDSMAFFKIYENSIKPKDDLPYKYIFKMIKIVLDISTEYIGGNTPGNFEFAYGTFVHIENFVHEFSKELDTGVYYPYIIYIIKLMFLLAQKVDYTIIFPAEFGGDSIGLWDTNFIIVPFEISNSDVPYDVNKELSARASQLGIDIKEDTVDLSKFQDNNFVDQFPAYFVIFDYHRQRIRRQLDAILPWDYFKLPPESIVNLFR